MKPGFGLKSGWCAPDTGAKEKKKLVKKENVWLKEERQQTKPYWSMKSDNDFDLPVVVSAPEWESVQLWTGHYSPHSHCSRRSWLMSLLTITEREEKLINDHNKERNYVLCEYSGLTLTFPGSLFIMCFMCVYMFIHISQHRAGYTTS